MNGSILTVVEKTSYIKNSQWLNSYNFMEPRACCTETIRTPRPSGVAVRGSVIEAGMDRSRLRLVTDGFGESPESTHLCPVYYAGSGKGYSGQPEKGDVQYLYFPTGQDKDRYVIGCVDAGSEKMEQLDKRERDENAVDAPKPQAAGAGAELPDTKSWSTPGNRRMILNRNGVSFVNSLKGRVNVRSSGIRVWTNGNMTLGAKEIAGGGQKITAEAGDYVWLGSGSSGMLLLPDQVQISAADVYMKRPLNWIHKIIDEETTKTLLDLYEEMKTSAPPVMAPDGTVIQRDGYDDILYSEELYDYFLNHVVGKEEDYKRENGEPYVTLYEQWLDETYGHSAMWYFWDYVFSIDGLQTMLDIGGFFFDGCDLVNAAIYLLRGRGKEAFWSFVGAVPFIGSVIMAKKGTKLLSAAGNISTALKTEEAVTGLTLTYKLEDTGTKLASKTGDLSSIYKLKDTGTKLVSTVGDLSTAMKTGDVVSELSSMYKLEGKGTKLVSAAGDLPTAMKTGDAMSELSSMYKLEDTGTEFFKEVTPVVEEMCSTMNNSTSGLAVAGNMVCDNMGVTVKTIDNAGDVVEILKTNKGGTSTRISNKFPNEAMPSDGKIIDYYIENGKIKGIEGINKVDFVITTDNKLIIGNKHHYLGNGQDVLAAGQLKINGQGQIKRIDNLSGHYRPTVDEAMGYQSLFEGLELDLNKTWLKYYKIDIDADGMVVNTYTDYVKMLGGEN